MDYKSRTNLKKVACKQDSLQLMKRFCEKQAAHNARVAGKNKVRLALCKERAEKRAAVIASTVAISDVNIVECLRVKELDIQLRWHHAQGSKLPVGIEKKNRQEKQTVLKELVQTYLAHSQPSQSQADVDMDSVGESESEDSRVEGSNVEMSREDEYSETSDEE
uniref:Uncharacterized protein n=1 Tax=Moniliophthora roreri TaxID=221103 RepID=A0A0W0EWB5_MONRR